MSKLENLLSNLKMERKVIISDHQRSLTGMQFVSEVRRIATELTALGVADGRSVLLRVTNTIDSVTTLFGAMACNGLVFVSNPFEPIESVHKKVTDFAPYILLADQATARAIERRYGPGDACAITPTRSQALFACRFPDNKHPWGSSDPRMREASIAIFSSGTTGEPKAILHRINSVFTNALLHAESIGLRASDVVGCVLPIYYSYGLVATVLSSLLSKSHLVLNPKKEAVQEKWIHENNISVLGLTPYFGQKLKLKRPTCSLRVLTFGGDVLYKRAAQEIREQFPHCDLFSTYGLTEAGPRVSTWRFDCEVLRDSEIAPIGTPLKGVGMSLRDSNGECCDHGELVVDTSTRMLGYLFGKDRGFDTLGWPHGRVFTGDLFNRKDGEIFFAGRKKDIIVQGGEKLFPLALESVIYGIDGVLDVRVDGIHHHEKGQIAKAFIHAKEHVTRKTVRKALLKKFSHSTLPEELEFVDAIPRTFTGKRSRIVPARS